MARITVEDCLDNVGNRFDLVMLATKRARQLATGGKEPMVKEDSDKATVIALREIAEGLVDEETIAARNMEEDIADVFEESDAENSDVTAEEAAVKESPADSQSEADAASHESPAEEV